jgi:hypothetical protein
VVQYALTHPHKPYTLRMARRVLLCSMMLSRSTYAPSVCVSLLPSWLPSGYAENGKTYQYGIIHKRCPKGYRPQAGWCAATVQKNWDRWHKAGAKGEFITYLGGIYCPVGAKNDPTGLNKHWIKNVTKFQKRFAYPTK